MKRRLRATPREHRNKRSMKEEGVSRKAETQPRNPSASTAKSAVTGDTNISLLLSDDRLCSRCKEIDFNAARSYAQHRKLLGACVAKLGNIVDETALATCVLCKFFLDTRPVTEAEDERIGKYHLRSFSASSEFQQGQSHLTQVAKGLQFYQILPGDGDEPAKGPQRLPLKQPQTIPITILPAFHQESLRSPADEQYTHRYWGRKLDRIIQDYSPFSSWLDDCSSSHIRCRFEAKSGDSITLKAIDCISRQIVNLDRGEQYLALSYVWGSPDLRIHEEHRAGRPGTFVQVVEDAMLVVRGLGERFLWVDQYCIDPDDRQAQIHSMDIIYERAYATIISLAPDSDHGLPGVSINLRLIQPSIKLHNGFLVSALPPNIYTLVSESVWSSRAWTFQELQLSRRCLIFTSQQVLGICRHGWNAETEILPHGWTKAWSKNKRPDLKRFWSSSSRGKADLADQITEYTKRILTFESDILNAFQGMLNRSQHLTYFGVPLFDDRYSVSESRGEEFNKAFTAGLAWSIHKNTSHFSRAHVGRRRGFPSWSWIGWKGNIKYFHLTPGIFDQQNKPVKIWQPQVWMESLEGSLIPLEELFESGSPNVIPEQSKFIHVEAMVVRVRFRQWSLGGADEYFAYIDRVPPKGLDPFHFNFINDDYGLVEFSSLSAPEPESLLHTRMLSEGIDGIILMKHRDPISMPYYFYYILLVKDCGGFMERVGCVVFRRRTRDFDVERRTFRIG